jgi:hypothetical protein
MEQCLETTSRLISILLAVICAKPADFEAHCGEATKRSPHIVEFL